MIKTISWVGQKGNTIELRARCAITMRPATADLDGDILSLGEEPFTDANLELWVDGKKMDGCWNINFWKTIDHQDGLKKIWGLPVCVTLEQAVIVDAFLKDVIESGKSKEVIEYETKKAEAKKQERKAEAQKVIDTAAKYKKPLMTNAEYDAWAKRYNDINNEGGEGYIPALITVEQLEHAKRIIEE